MLRCDQRHSTFILTLIDLISLPESIDADYQYMPLKTVYVAGS